MARKISFKAITADFIRHHGDSVIEALRGAEDFLGIEECAREEGVFIEIEQFGTYTDEKKFSYHLPKDADDVPYGMQLDIMVSLTDGQNVLFVTDEEGNAVQCSTTFTVMRTADTLFGKKAWFLDVEDIDFEETFDLIEDFLDKIEEDESRVKTSVVCTASLCPEDSDVFFDTEPFEGAVEVMAGNFEGLYGNEGSLYFNAATFLPFAYLLEGRMFGFYMPHGVSSLDKEAWETFKDDANALVHMIDGGVSFADMLIDADVFSIMPTAAAEEVLNTVTLRQKALFKKTVDALLALGDDAIEEKGTLSILWA